MGFAEGKKINYQIIRSKRKTLAIHIKNGKMEVRAPLKMPKTHIDIFVASKEDWITVKLAQSKEELGRRDKFNLTYGDTILFLGHECPIIASNSSFYDFSGKRFYIQKGLDSENIKEICIRLYQDAARDYINKRAAIFSEVMGVTPISVKITKAKSRWGSCTATKRINFSWLLIMADSEVIDYVVVHEIAHLKELNHSAQFWAIVENILPDYRQRKARLKELSKRLSEEDW